MAWEMGHEHAGDEAVAFWCKVFDQPADLFTPLLASVGPGSQRLLTAREGGRLLGTVQVYSMPFSIEGAPARPWGCVATVATDPGARGQGIASALMTEADAVMREEFGCACGLLFTGVHGFYERLGWKEQFGHVVTGRFSGVRGRPPVDDVFGVLGELARLYEVGITGSVKVVRDDAAWEHRLGPRLARTKVFLTGHAYVATCQWEHSVAVLEVAGEAWARAELVKEALGWYSVGSEVRVHFDMPPPPEVVAELDDPSYERVGGGMAKAILCEIAEIENFRIPGEDSF